GAHSQLAAPRPRKHRRTRRHLDQLERRTLRAGQFNRRAKCLRIAPRQQLRDEKWRMIEPNLHGLLLRLEFHHELHTLVQLLPTRRSFFQQGSWRDQFEEDPIEWPLEQRAISLI